MALIAHIGPGGLGQLLQEPIFLDLGNPLSTARMAFPRHAMT